MAEWLEKNGAIQGLDVQVRARSPDDAHLAILDEILTPDHSVMGVRQHTDNRTTRAVWQERDDLLPHAGDLVQNRTGKPYPFHESLAGRWAIPSGEFEVLVMVGSVSATARTGSYGTLEADRMGRTEGPFIVAGSNVGSEPSSAVHHLSDTDLQNVTASWFVEHKLPPPSFDEFARTSLGVCA